MSTIIKARNFHNYKVWKDSVDFATEVYKVTSEMPWFEKKGLCDQLQRASVSISSNIAEGAGRPSDVDFAHFLDLSVGSTNEVETQLIISRNVGYVSADAFEKLMTEVVDIRKQLLGLIKTLRNTK